MIGPAGAAGRLLLCAMLLSGLWADPLAASPTRQADPVAQRSAVAVAEAKAMRQRGQRLWCVPFARTASGIEIKGNAKTWWASAKGLYRRGAEPAVGAVMVFSGSRAMPLGHVAVVARVVNDRMVLVDHANWKRNQVSLGTMVVDVSQAGDWSAVRVANSPGSYGRVNPVSGFIYPGEMVASR